MESTRTLQKTPRTPAALPLAARPGAPVVRPPVAATGPRGHGGDDPELVLGRYRLLERLGAGGFGVVWRARDELLGREVALKRIAGVGGHEQRASREALATARLAHPAIVALYEACACEDAFYLISELVHGDTLAARIAAEDLCDRELLEIGLALADALSHAHARGVIHRDVKPSNVLVPRGASGERGDRTRPHPAAKLTDFGGALLAGEDMLTRTGDVLGTLAYMAPEQVEHTAVGTAADLYSLALVLYEGLSGANPVRGPTPAATVRRIGRPVDALASRRPDLPRALSDALDRALRADPAERGSLDELRSALLGAAPLLRPPAAVTARPPAATTLVRSSRTAAPHRRAARLPETTPARLPDTPHPARHEGLELSDAFELPAARSARRAGRDERREAQAQAQEEALARHGAPTHLALPRAVWIAGGAAAVAWQLAEGRPGAGVLLALALAPLLALPRRAGPGWLACALAPVLGTIGLAGAFPAAAGQARSWRTRFALGALGYWWLTLAEPLLGQRLWLGQPAGLQPRATWEHSLGGALHTAGALLGLGALLGAALWGVAALCLPLLVRGRRVALDLVAVVMWSAALAAAAPAFDRGVSAAGTHASPRGAVLGAVLGAALALAARALRGPV